MKPLELSKSTAALAGHPTQTEEVVAVVAAALFTSSLQR
jgi:hypothetical protein